MRESFYGSLESNQPARISANWQAQYSKILKQEVVQKEKELLLFTRECSKSSAICGSILGSRLSENRDAFERPVLRTRLSALLSLSSKSLRFARARRDLNPRPSALP